MKNSTSKQDVYGVIAKFSEVEPFISAIKDAKKRGFKALEGFTPFPIDEVHESLPLKSNKVPLVTLIGGILGGASGYFMQWYCNVISYRINVGGRPDYSWPAFIPVTFELTVLGAALFAGFGMIFLNHLPKLYHPVFNLETFREASLNRFFLCILSSDSKYSDAESFLKSLNSAEEVLVVPREEMK